MQRKWHMSVVQVSIVRAVVLALMSSLLTAVVAVTTTTPAQAIAAQGNMMSSLGHGTCVIDASGQLYCWGWNNMRQVADTSTSGETVTLMALPAGVVARAVNAGGSANCVISQAQELYCQGYSQFDGALAVPTKVAFPGGARVRSVALSEGYDCVVVESGQVLCAGNNSFGELGRARVADGFGGYVSRSKSLPVDLPAGESATVVSGNLASGMGLQAGSTCAAMQSGKVYCWGANAYGQVGNPSMVDTFTATPQQVSLPESATSVTSGTDFNCALTTVGHVYCWGRNSYGTLGNETTTSSSTPVRALLPETVTATMLVAGSNHVCATDGISLYCWGSRGLQISNVYGAPEASDWRPHLHTVYALGVGERIIGLGLGAGHTCVMSTVRTRCNGLNIGIYNTLVQGNGNVEVDNPVEVGSFSEAARSCSEVTSATGQNFTGADFSYCDFTKVPGASFAGDTLTATNLTGANLTGMDLAGANMTNTQLAGALVDMNAGPIVGVPISNPESRMLFNHYFRSPVTGLSGQTLARGSDTQTTHWVMQDGSNTYFRTLAYEEDSVTVSAFPVNPDPSAYTLRINSSVVASGEYKVVPLSLGLNTITIVVTLSGTSTSETTTILVERNRCDRLPAPGIDLSNCDLRSTPSLVGANLTGANLSSANLTGKNLTNANLTNATLTSANLWDAELTNTNLTGANMQNATVTRLAGPVVGTPSALPTQMALVANVFRSTDTSWWDRTVGVGSANSPLLNLFFSAALTFESNPVAHAVDSVTVRVRKENPGQTVFIGGTEVPSDGQRNSIKVETLTVGENVIPILIRADDGVSMTTRWLSIPRIADCSASAAPGVNLFGCDLRSRALAGANLSNANLSRANMSGMNLESVTASGANLTKANLSGANLQRANLRDADLTDADASNTDLRLAMLETTTVSRAMLSNAQITPGAGPVLSGPSSMPNGFYWISGGYFRSSALSELTVNVPMSPAFNVNTFDYNVNLPNSTSSLQFTITPVDSATTVKLEFNPLSKASSAPYSAVATVAVPVGTTTYRVIAEVAEYGGGSHMWNVHVTRAAAAASSGGGGGGGAPASAPAATAETSTATPKVETSTVTSKVETATATGGASTGGSTSTGSGSVNETPTVTAPLVTTEVRRLVFTYTSRQTVLNKSQLQRLRSQLTATTTAVSVLGYVTRSKSTSADRAKSLQRANRAASQIVRTSSTPKPTTRGAGGAKAKGCEKAKNNCVVVLITRTK